MKYCPYCGADLLDDAVSFCAECGKQLPVGKQKKESPKEGHETKSVPKKKKSKKKVKKKPESFPAPDAEANDGYDGYYDDIHPIDEGHEREGVDKELIKKIAIIIGGLFVVIIACVALMYVL